MLFETLSFKVSPELAERLRQEAARRNMSKKFNKSNLVREILEAHLPPLDVNVSTENKA